MDLRITPEEQCFRDEIRRFFENETPAETRKKYLEGRKLSREELVTCQRIVHMGGWSVPLWPVELGGRDLTPAQFYIFREEQQRAGVPEPAAMNTYRLGPVLFTYGTEAQRQRFLPHLGNLSMWFCQGYSEPGSGSDLASLRTRAERDGDHYVINGQKMWTSYAHHADWIFALVKTDPNAAKPQQGISFMLVDLKTPGITIRPIVTMDRRHETNEVFFDNVRVPVENRIGPENKGWDVAKLVLSIERVGHSHVGTSKRRLTLARNFAAEVPVGEGSLLDDISFRRQLASAEVEVKALEMTLMRVVDAESRGAAEFNPASAVLKIRGAEIQQTVTELLMQIAGPHVAPVRGETRNGDWTEPPVGPEWASPIMPNYAMLRVVTIAGGSSEIQRNIIAKSYLGL